MKVEIVVQTSDRTAYRMHRASEWIRTTGRAEAKVALEAVTGIGAIGMVFFMCGADSPNLAPVITGFAACSGMTAAAAAVRWVIG